MVCVCVFFMDKINATSTAYLGEAKPEFWQYKYIAFPYSRQMYEYFGVNKILREKETACVVNIR